MTDRQPVNTETILNLIAKIQFMLQVSREKRMVGADPRYDALVIKCQDLISRLQKLVPAVMLNDIAHFEVAAKDLYKTLGEREDFAIKGDKDAGH